MAEMADLTLHAKTYYDHPRYENSGDEHYFYIYYNSSSIEIRSASYWKKFQGMVVISSIPIMGGDIIVSAEFKANTLPGMEKAILLMSTKIGYWFKKPTGFMSADWSAELVHCQYHVTKVTT